MSTNDIAQRGWDYTNAANTKQTKADDDAKRKRREKEEAEGKVSVRSRFLGDEGQKDLGEFIAAIQEEIQNKVNRKVETEE